MTRLVSPDASRTERVLTRLALGVVALAAIGGVGLLWVFDPNAPGSFFPKCQFKAITGLDCIGCGATRALHALVHGDVLRAMDMNPLFVLSLPLLALLALDAIGRLPAGLKPFLARVAAPKLWLCLLPAFWIARNLPWWPFSWMASG